MSIEYTWTGKAGDNNFDNPGNWSPSGFNPSANDAAVTITKDATVIQGNSTDKIVSLTIEGGSSLALHGNFTVDSIISVSGDSTLAVKPGAVLDSLTDLNILHGSTVVIKGTLAGNGNISGDGNLVIDGGTTATSPALDPAFLSCINYTIQDGGVLAFNTAPLLGSITFGAGDNTLKLPTWNGILITPIYGLENGDNIIFAGETVNDVIKTKNHDGTYTLTFQDYVNQYNHPDTTILTDVHLSPNATVSIVDVGGNAELVIGDAGPHCLKAGTMIATPRGEVAIEELNIGDMVLSHDGQELPIVWIGTKHVNDNYNDPIRYNPIRIAAGALGENFPNADLFLSPCHAVFIDGILAHASALVNDVNVERESMIFDPFTYYHIELKNHELILANGVPVETFVDNVDRMAFDNWDEHVKMFGETSIDTAIIEMSYPRAKSIRQLPPNIRTALLERAGKASVNV